MSHSERKVWTEQDLAVFDALQTPLWVFDFASYNKWWANRRGLELWSASSIEELRERGRNAPISDATRMRLDKMRAQLERGETSRERWNFYPTGRSPFVADVLIGPILISEPPSSPPRVALLSEARPLGDDDIDPFVRRGVEVLRHMGEMVSLYKPNGELIMRNPAAIHALGDGANAPPGTDLFAAHFVSPTDCQAIRTALENGPAKGVFEVYTKEEIVWHALDARRTVDPVTGEVAVLVNQRDINDRIRADQTLAENRAILEQQTEQLRRLSASPLRVWKGILALPLIGRIDHARVRAGLEGIEERATREPIKVVLLDLTGTEVVDGQAADAIRGLIQTLKLQGIASRVVGVRALLARTLVSEDIDLGNVPLHASLAHALATELRR